MHSRTEVLLCSYRPEEIKKAARNSKRPRPLHTIQNLKALDPKFGNFGLLRPPEATQYGCRKSFKEKETIFL
jgi:hypothetical protein